MGSKIKKIFTNARVIALLVFVVLAAVAIHPEPWSNGVAIRNVISNSSANIEGIQNPKPGIQPMARERILSINNAPIIDLEDYDSKISGLLPNRTLHITTNKASYILRTAERIDEIELNETIQQEITEEVFDEELNKTVNQTKIIEVPKIKLVSTGLAEDIGIRAYEAPKTNIRKGLDLEGGTRILLKPEEKLSDDDMDMLISNMKERLNVYGLSDLTIRSAGDLSGNKYILVEIAGATEEEVKSLLARQGKFEAKVGNTSVFKGGNDIPYVCRSADCAGLDPQYGCSQSSNQWVCRFRFSIKLSQEAAMRQAEATKELDVITEDKQKYLSEKLYLFLDDKLVDELRIGADLKWAEGKEPAKDIQISGSGTGLSQQEAAVNTLESMKKLQTILATGSLPVKLNIEKMDTISPVLGDEFIRSALLMALAAVSVVLIMIFLRYREIRVVLPILLTLSSEVVILLGVAALVRWNLDLAAIAGMIISIGTGVDNLIVISDEVLRKESTQVFDWKKRIKNAFFIITGSYLTTVVAVIWLGAAGAGLLKGFAFTTIAGASIGIFIARPAYAAVIEILLRE